MSEWSELKKFYAGKRVFVTGHSGFKGIWLVKILSLLGANATGYALPPTGATEKVFSEAKIAATATSVFGDIRDFACLRRAFDDAAPEVVFHLAAQPIVREGYRDPVGTYAVNVMGTVHILESIRQNKNVRSAIIVTTDKVYDNREWQWGYREIDCLGGRDPYANSKSCAELVTKSYKQSFLSDNGVSVSTVRAGNVIGGGDFAPHRIIPDCIRAAYAEEKISVRNPGAVRPYQHVLEPLFVYLRLAMLQSMEPTLADSYNIGPEADDCVQTRELAEIFCESWGEKLTWEGKSDAAIGHEANFLKLDCAKIKTALHWKPHWNIRQAVIKTVEWAKAYQCGENIDALMTKQVFDYAKSQGG